MEGVSEVSFRESLSPYNVIISTGTGGVGKTTVSAGMGAMLAAQGKKVLVLTIDPAQRLAQALGLGTDISESVRVHIQGSGELYASMIDAQGIFDRFVDRFSPSSQVAQKLKANRLYRQLVTALTGSQEFTSMERLLLEYESGKYDVIILDTPPSQNAIDFFKAPQRITALFDQAITKWFIKGATGVGFLTKIVSKGTQAALSALERITGSEFIGELSDFFEQMSFLQAQVRERSQKVKTLMEQATTGFILVTGSDPQKQIESAQFLKTLSERNLKIHSVIVNRAYPKWLGEGEQMALSSTPLARFYNQAKTFYRSQNQLIEKFKKQLWPIPVLQIPEGFKSLNGLEDIVELANELEAY